MDQYLMPKKLDFKNLRFCLGNYKTHFINISDCGGYNPDGSHRMKGLAKVCENLEDKTLDFRKDKSGLYILIDSKEAFHFPLKHYEKGFYLAYDRVNKSGVISNSNTDDPYDPELPEPRRSFLRNVIDDHQLEIFFKGRIHLKFHSWWREPHWKYWTIAEDLKKE
jgi:hypothetical protein